MSLKLLEKSTNLPVELEQLKLFLRISNDAEDKLLTQMINSVTSSIEVYLNKKMLTQTWRLEINAEYAFARSKDGKPIKIPYAPFIKIAKDIKLKTADEVVNYDLIESKIMLDNCKQYNPKDNIVIDFVCGYGDDNTHVPDAIRQGILMMVGNLYENRVNDPSISVDFPIMNNQVRDILAPFLEVQHSPRGQII